MYVGGLLLACIPMLELGVPDLTELAEADPGWKEEDMDMESWSRGHGQESGGARDSPGLQR